MKLLTKAIVVGLTAMITAGCINTFDDYPPSAYIPKRRVVVTRVEHHRAPRVIVTKNRRKPAPRVVVQRAPARPASRVIVQRARPEHSRRLVVTKTKRDFIPRIAVEKMNSWPSRRVVVSHPRAVVITQSQAPRHTSKAFKAQPQSRQVVAPGVVVTKAKQPAVKKKVLITKKNHDQDNTPRTNVVVTRAQ